MDQLLASYRRRKLNPEKQIKPLDFGENGLIGSLNRNGRIVALCAYHSAHGIFTLTTAPPFDESQRYNADAARAYRRSLTDLPGFGLAFTETVIEREAWLVEDAIPHLRLTLANGVVADCVTFVATTRGRTCAVQYWRFSEGGEFARFTGKLWIQRAAYTQLTEGGPMPMPAVDTRVHFQRGLGLTGIENSDLGGSAYLSEHGVTERADGSIEFTGDGGPRPQSVKPRPGVPLTTEYSLFVALGENQHEAETNLLVPSEVGARELLTEKLNEWSERWTHEPDPDDALDFPRRRGSVYSFQLNVPTDDEASCLLTDHMLLPLSWNRDAYFMVRALLGWNDEGDDLVRRHLLWMWLRAERDDGFWGRAYLANGKVKDRAYQLDQQLFPLLQLAEYVTATGDQQTWARLRGPAKALLDALFARRAADDLWLFDTEETPSDDPVEQPYHLSSHLLFWHVLNSLVPLDFDVADAIDNLRDAIEKHFIVDHAGRLIFAYTVDLKGAHTLYHDAGDLPLVLAPLWGLFPADNDVWRNTVDFAFSGENKDGIYDGLLGSVHTPSPWPLGDEQEVIVTSLTGEAHRLRAARGRLAHAAQWDGALPEAYDSRTFEVVSRHWFAWPNALLAYIKDLL